MSWYNRMVITSNQFVYDLLMDQKKVTVRKPDDTIVGLIGQSGGIHPLHNPFLRRTDGIEEEAAPLAEGQQQGEQ